MKKVPLATLLMAALLQIPTPFAWANDYTVNQKVEVNENGTWYPSTILKVDGERCFIHYDGYQSQYDLWVGPDLVRAAKSGASKSGGGAAGTIDSEGATVDASTLKVNDIVYIWHNGMGQFAWTQAQIMDIKDGQFQFHYGGSRYNLVWMTADKIRGTKEQVNAAAEAQIDIFTKQAFEKFEAAVTSAEAVVRSNPGPEALRSAVESATQAMKADYAKALRHPRVKPIQMRYWAFATKEVDFLLAEAMVHVKKAEAKTDINFARNNGGVLKSAQDLVAEYKAFAGGTDAEAMRLDAIIGDALQKIEATVAKIKVAYVANARVPSETYTGGDKAQVKAMILAAWKKKFPNLPVLKLIASTNWKRDRYWNSSAGRSYWHDNSTLVMDLVAKKDGTLATVYPVGVMYTGGDRRTMAAGVGDRGYGNFVPFDVLLKNVK